MTTIHDLRRAAEAMMCPHYEENIQCTDVVANDESEFKHNLASVCRREQCPRKALFDTLDAAEKYLREREVSVEVIESIEGRSLYIDGVHVAGPKPWGDGTSVLRWKGHLAAFLDPDDSTGGDAE